MVDSKDLSNQMAEGRINDLFQVPVISMLSPFNKDETVHMYLLHQLKIS